MTPKNPPGYTICKVEQSGDHITIRTTPRRSQAILMVMGGASVREVGDHFGVSYQRICQYLRDAGLSASTRKRFVDSKAQQAYHRQFTKTSNKLTRAARKRRTKERVRATASWVRSYADSNGCAPSTRQIVEAMKGRPCKKNEAGVRLVFYLAGRGADQGYPVRRMWRWVRIVFRLAGVEQRPRGSLGHHDGGLAAAQGVARWWANLSPKERAQEVAKRLAAKRKKSLLRERQ